MIPLKVSDKRKIFKSLQISWRFKLGGEFSSQNELLEQLSGTAF